MKNTDHHQAFMHDPNVLVVFTGHHIYVSGTWYSNPHTPSTWNYMSVHVKGVVRFLDDDALVDVLRSTTRHFEDNDPRSTTFYDNLPAEYTARLMKAIVAFEIEGLATAAAFKPDVILLDIGLPNLNGYEVAKRVRKEAWGRDIFLVALTGWGQDEDRNKSAEAGFDMHLVKPVDLAQLRAVLSGPLVRRS